MIRYSQIQGPEDDQQYVVGYRQTLGNGGALLAFDASHDSLQTKAVLERIREAKLDVQGSDGREVHFDGGVPKRGSRGCSKKAQGPLVRRAGGTVSMDPARLDAKLVESVLRGSIRPTSSGSQTLRQERQTALL